MRNLKVCISYNGAAYHGFQRQNNAASVQQTVEEAMSKLLGQSVTINGCSRTDTGVHAREFYFNAKIDNNIPCEGFIKGMNSLLPTILQFIPVLTKARIFMHDTAPRERNIFIL